MNFYKHFIPLASFILFTLSAYGIIGIVFNSRAISPPNVFRGVWPLNEKPAIVVLMVAQGGLVFTSVFGLIGVLRKTYLIFYSPAFILLGVFSTLSIFGILCIRQSREDISHVIFRTVQGGQNKSVDPEHFSWLSDLQWEFECCGVKSYMDWDFIAYSELAPQSVPYSCCIRNLRVPARNCGESVLSPSRTKVEIESTIFSKGCGPKISTMHSHALKWIGIEMLTVALCSFLVAAFLYFGVTKLMRREKEGREPEGPEAGNTDGNESEPGDDPSSNRPPNRRRGRESAVSFAEDLRNNNQGDRRVPRFRAGRATRQGPTCSRMKNRPNHQSTNQHQHQARARAIPTGNSLEFRLRFKKITEMLLHPRDNHSVQSTTPYPSDAQNFRDYFHHSKDSKAESGDSDMNLTSEKHKHRLSHYSSLPQVYLVPNPPANPGDSEHRAKVMAELRQRIPPNFKNPGVYKLKVEARTPSTGIPPSPLLAFQNLHTQHHHYYRIPSPCHSVLPPSANIRAGEGQGQAFTGIGSQTTLSFPTDNLQATPTIFEVFGTEEGNGPNSMFGGEEEGQVLVDLDLEHLQLDLEPGFQDAASELLSEAAGALGEPEVHLENNENKVEPEQMDALVFFNVGPLS